MGDFWVPHSDPPSTLSFNRNIPSYTVRPNEGWREHRGFPLATAAAHQDLTLRHADSRTAPRAPQASVLTARRECLSLFI